MRSFIILRSGEDLTFFSINNCTNFFVRKSKMRLSESGVSFFWRIRAKAFKLNLVFELVLVLKTKLALY